MILNYNDDIEANHDDVDKFGNKWTVYSIATKRKIVWKSETMIVAPVVGKIVTKQTERVTGSNELFPSLDLQGVFYI